MVYLSYIIEYEHITFLVRFIFTTFNLCYLIIKCIRKGGKSKLLVKVNFSHIKEVIPSWSTIGQLQSLKPHTNYMHCWQNQWSRYQGCRSITSEHCQIADCWLVSPCAKNKAVLIKIHTLHNHRSLCTYHIYPDIPYIPVHPTPGLCPHIQWGCNSLSFLSHISLTALTVLSRC